MLCGREVFSACGEAKWCLQWQLEQQLTSRGSGALDRDIYLHMSLALFDNRLIPLFERFYSLQRCA